MEQPVEEPEAEEVTEPKADEAAESLAESDVAEALKASDLPKSFHKWVAGQKYADKDALDKAIVEAIEDVKKLTGSGQPVGLGESEAVHPVEEREEQSKESFNAVMRKFGLREVS